MGIVSPGVKVALRWFLSHGAAVQFTSCLLGSISRRLRIELDSRSRSKHNLYLTRSLREFLLHYSKRWSSHPTVKNLLSTLASPTKMYAGLSVARNDCWDWLIKAYQDLPPSYSEASASTSSETRAADSPNRSQADARPLPPLSPLKVTNYVSTVRLNGAVKNSWVIDPQMVIPAPLLSSLGPGETEADRKNLYIRTNNGKVVADVTLVSNASNRRHRDFALFHAETLNGSITFDLVSKRVGLNRFKRTDASVSMTIHCNHMGLHASQFAFTFTRWTAPSTSPSLAPSVASSSVMGPGRPPAIPQARCPPKYSIAKRMARPPSSLLASSMNPISAKTHGLATRSMQRQWMGQSTSNMTTKWKSRNGVIMLEILWGW